MKIEDQAKEAAKQWNGNVVRLLSQRENAVFEIALPSGRAALRLHRKGYQDASAVRSELWWCAALAHKGVSVSSAIVSRSGDLLVQLSNGAYASAIDWVEGEPLGDAGTLCATSLEDTLAQYRALGQLLAQLHTVTDGLALPSNFRRPKWDIQGLVGEAPLWGRFWEHPSATASQAATLRKARDFLRDRLTVYAEHGDFGLIHADVLRENVLVNHNSLSLIDFDDSGYGFRLYDLGTALIQGLSDASYVSIRDALIAGYTETKHATIELVEVFILARTCASVGWTAPRLLRDDPINNSHIARATALARRICL